MCQNFLPMLLFRSRERPPLIRHAGYSISSRGLLNSFGMGCRSPLVDVRPVPPGVETIHSPTVDCTQCLSICASSQKKTKNTLKPKRKAHAHVTHSINRRRPRVMSCFKVQQVLCAREPVIITQPVFFFFLLRQRREHNKRMR